MPHLELSPIGNCAVSSLIDDRGRHVWFGFPRLDSDPLFNALLNGEDPLAGFMDVVVDGFESARQSYQRNTAILETILRTKTGEELRIIDFAPRFAQFGRNYRPPMLVRRIEPLIGQPRITIRIRPTFEYGATRPQTSFGSNHARFVGAETTLRVTSDIGPSYILNETPFLLTRPISLFIGPDEGLNQDPDGLARQFIHETAFYWADWTRKLAIPFEWQDAVIRAAITLKLCSYEETGAVLAALTTSMPEAPNTGRNWDYRFSWVRDSYFTVNALNRLGVTRTMENFVRFLMDTVASELPGELKPLYPIIPGTDLTEIEATALAGFRGMGPVRVGNAAADQRQNDVFGSIILSAAQLFWDHRVSSMAGLELYRRLCPIGEAALESAMTPDAGVWEYRTRSSVHTYSAAMCWAAAHRMGMIAARIGQFEDSVRWEARAQNLREEILRSAVTADGWISGACNAEVADASVLLLPQIGLLNASDPRFLRTLEISEERLLRNGFLLRYNDADDFGVPETAFTVCTFWYIDALAAVGRQAEARTLFTNLLSRRNSAGLLSEDIDPLTGELWGNFPQTYSLVGLILSAHRLSQTWEQGLWHASL
ncbi:MAG TPA: glycoside hydrolase family 15 protein [Caulobacteraceae bacterium]|jgi:GH15 family glucan-1,4-alpha-glucosidase|nr:glycoside hydrolase family 15 protein [Caulobacteraceae bacterium]